MIVTVELHGWLSIWETYEDEDTFPQEELDGIMRRVKDIVSQSSIEIRYVNGLPFIDTLMYTNHRTKEIEDVIKAYTSISETATGSYGVICLRDDEDEEHYNEFQMYVFRKGKCIRRADKDFSPCIPMIEDG